MFSDQVTPQGFSAEVRARNEWVLRGFGLLDPIGLNVSHRDLGFLATLTRRDAYDASVKELPVLSRFVSANVVPLDDSVRPFAPYLITEVRGKRLGDKPLRIGVLGLTELPSGFANARQKVDVGGYTITDPTAAAARLVPELRAKCDILVVLAYMEREPSKRLGASVPGIDMILSARSHPYIGRVDEAGDAVVAYAMYETKYLGEMRLYRSEGAKAGQIASYIHRDVYLDSGVPDEPNALATMGRARAAIMAAAQASSAPRPGSQTRP